MSDDSYNVVRKHPAGGFTYVNVSASDDEPDLTIRRMERRYDTAQEAYDAACAEYTEYGVSLDPDCGYSLFLLPTDGA